MYRLLFFSYLDVLLLLYREIIGPYPYIFALATLSLPLLNHQKLAIFVIHSTEEI